MPATVVMPFHLHFPPEIWGLTLQNFRQRKSQDELAYLWTTVRYVSRQFRNEIEEIFRTEHLPKTWLHIDTGERVPALGLQFRREAPSSHRPLRLGSGSMADECMLWSFLALLNC